ncbi:MAG: alanine racemase [Kiritimatiellia bacterium]|nr:alanine racemase [Kiritimatiellia bacterium]
MYKLGRPGPPAFAKQSVASRRVSFHIEIPIQRAIVDEPVKAYISRSALRHNVRLIQKTAANTPLCAMVKAAAYGHNTTLVVKALEGMNVAFWGVATLNEAVELRDLNVREPVIVMRPLTPYESEKAIREQIRLMYELEIRPTLSSDCILGLLAKSLAGLTKPLKAHIKVDTGMGRNGIPAGDTIALLRQANAVRGLRIEGIYSHFAETSSDNLDFAREQIAVFNSILKEIKTLNINFPLRHISNSGAVFNLPEARFDMVRPGKALYGYSSQNSKESLSLIPVMRVEAPVVCTKRLKKGTTCGYERTFLAKRATRIGLLPFGYADGYSRKLSNSGRVDFRGRLAPVIGQVSMDLTVVDLTDIPEATTGSLLCVISNRRADPHSIESTAGRLGTIPHEIGCNLGSRIQRILTE